MKVVLGLSDEHYELMEYVLPEKRHQLNVEKYGNKVTLVIVDGKKAIQYEGPRDHLVILTDLFFLRDIKFVNFEVLEYVTKTPEQLWWEKEVGYLVRMGKDYVLDLILTPNPKWSPREIGIQLSLYPYNLQLAIILLWNNKWDNAILNGRKTRVY